MNITSHPPRIDLVAIDLAVTVDDSGQECVTMRLIDATGARIDCPMPRRAAEAFGNSLADYAAQGIPAIR